MPCKHVRQPECPRDLGASLLQCKPSKKESKEEAVSRLMTQRQKSHSVISAILRERNEPLPFKDRSAKEFVGIY